MIIIILTLLINIDNRNCYWTLSKDTKEKFSRRYLIAEIHTLKISNSKELVKLCHIPKIQILWIVFPLNSNAKYFWEEKQLQIISNVNFYCKLLLNIWILLKGLLIPLSCEISGFSYFQGLVKNNK